jgi:hypothetical protein
MASEGIILRWSQLLDWRSDFWSRDLFRDRARRHILLLIGFGGLDPVIHSSLRSIMEEVTGRSQKPGEPRIQVIDRRPDTLTLRMLVLAGGGTGDETFVVGAPNPELAEVLLVLHCALIERRLREHLEAGSLPVPPDQRQRLLRFAVSGPAMVRLSMALLQRIGKLDLAGASLSSTEKGAETYVPLTWDPELTGRAFRVRDELAEFLGVPAEPDGRETVALRRAGTDARRYIPVGLSKDELDRAAHTGGLGDLRPFLQVEPDTVPILVAGGEGPGTLSARGVDSGEAVPL